MDLLLAELLHAAISAGNAPEGRIFDTFEAAHEAWERDGGHLLELSGGTPCVWFVTNYNQENIEIGGLHYPVTITEYMSADDDYEPNPSASQVMHGFEPQSH